MHRLNPRFRRWRAVGALYLLVNSRQQTDLFWLFFNFVFSDPFFVFWPLFHFRVFLNKKLIKIHEFILSLKRRYWSNSTVSAMYFSYESEAWKNEIFRSKHGHQSTLYCSDFDTKLRMAAFQRRQARQNPSTIRSIRGRLSKSTLLIRRCGQNGYLFFSSVTSEEKWSKG